MGTRIRAADAGAEQANLLLVDLGRAVRQARLDRGLSLAEVARATSTSVSTVSRIERAMLPSVSLRRIAVIEAVVGMRLVVRAYPGGQPLRDAAHVRLLSKLRARLHPSLSWATEVPLPLPGDLRAWDGLIAGDEWRYGVEAETGPRDAQALGRRLALKQRDGGTDGVILVLRAGVATRLFLSEAGEQLRPAFPIAGRTALRLLSAGKDPGGSAIIVL